jgi:hypothetical protein
MLVMGAILCNPACDLVWIVPSGNRAFGIRPVMLGLVSAQLRTGIRAYRERGVHFCFSGLTAEYRASTRELSLRARDRPIYLQH